MKKLNYTPRFFLGANTPCGFVSKFDNLSENSKNIINIVDSWIKATTPSNVVSAFKQAGFYTIIDEKGEYVNASIEYARAVRGLKHTECPTIIKGTKSKKLQEF